MSAVLSIDIGLPASKAETIVRELWSGYRRTPAPASVKVANPVLRYYVGEKLFEAEYDLSTKNIVIAKSPMAIREDFAELGVFISYSHDQLDGKLWYIPEILSELMVPYLLKNPVQQLSVGYYDSAIQKLPSGPTKNFLKTAFKNKLLTRFA